MKHNKIITIIILIHSTLHTLGSDNQSIYTNDLSKRGAYAMPYERYDSKDAQYGNGAMVLSSPDFNIYQIASNASNQEYINLPNKGSYLQWTINKPGNGLTIRFTLPDNETGSGTQDDLDIIINGLIVNTVQLDSKWCFAYFPENEPTHIPSSGCVVLFNFDEYRLLLKTPLQKGDILTLSKKGSASTIGIDYVELEPVGEYLVRPHNAICVTDAPYNADPTGNTDALTAFNLAISDANLKKKILFIPTGIFSLSNILLLKNCTNIQIRGAGIWYTNLYFTSNERKSSGITLQNCSNLTISDFYMNTNNYARFDFENGERIQRSNKAFGINGTKSSKIENIWVNHFNVGIWAMNQGLSIIEDIFVRNLRVRYTYADGINFAGGSQRCIVEYCNVRSAGDDGIATYSGNTGTCTQGQIFRWNTIEHVWRASGIGAFGGGGHRIYNCIVSENVFASGIRFVGSFEGCPYDLNDPIHVENCLIYKCGSKGSVFQQIYAGIYLGQNNYYPVFGMKFSNIDIVDSQTNGIRLIGDSVYDITFSDININGTGLSGNASPVKTSEEPTYAGAGVYCNTKVLKGAKSNATFINCRFENIKTGHEKIYNNPRMPFVLDIIDKPNSILNQNNQQKKFHIKDKVLYFNEKEPKELIIFDLLGRQMKRKESSDSYISLCGIPEGMYMAVAYSKEYIDGFKFLIYN